MPATSSKLKIIGTGLSGLVGQRFVELTSDVFEFVDFSLDTNVDILNYEQLAKAYANHTDACAVVHFAAFTDTAAAWAQRGDRNGLCYRLNVEGTKHILDLARLHGQHFIYISTDFVFDGEKTTSYIESDAPNPIEWYGETKYFGEQLVISSGAAACIARITYPYRASFAPKSDIVRKVIAKLRAKEPVTMFNDQLCTHTFIDDIALALRRLIKHRDTGIYHLVGSSSQSPFELSLSIADVFGLDKALVRPSSLAQYVAGQPAGSRPWQKSLITSNEKIRALGVQFATLKEGLRRIATS